MEGNQLTRVVHTRDMQPVAESIRLPKAYGKPSKLLLWRDVEARLVEAMHYWLATTRPEGKPHVVPVDGIWEGGACYFSGDPATVHERNLRADSHAVIHLDDSESATGGVPRRRVATGARDRPGVERSLPGCDPLSVRGGQRSRVAASAAQ